MALNALSASSLETLTKLATHQTGIPVISTSDSVLSDLELEYIELFTALSSLQLELDQLTLANIETKPSPNVSEDQLNTLQILLHKSKFNHLVLESVITAHPTLEAVTNGPRPGQSPLLQLLFNRDLATAKLNQHVNHNKELETRLRVLSAENTSLHSQNQRLVSQIDQTLNQVKAEHQSQFSPSQLEKYHETKRALLAARNKTAVLNELLVALVAATGVDWVSDSLLRQIVLECGEEIQKHRISDENDLDLDMAIA